MNTIKKNLCRAAGLVMLVGIASSDAAAGLRVVASILPVHSLVAGVMKGVGSPLLLLDGRSSPHSFSLKPSQARQLQDADLVFWIGPDLETFLSKPLATIASKSHSVRLDDIDGIHLIAYRHQKGSRGSAGNEEHDGEGDDHDHGTGNDPHIWLDPENAIAIVSRIERELVELDPNNRARYDANAAAIVERLEVLTRETQELLKPLAGKKFMVLHDAYLYFEHRFGVESVGALTINPEISPGAKRLREIQQQVSDAGITCLFSEPQFDHQAWSGVMGTANVRLGTLDPMGWDNPPGPELYFQLIGNMAKSMSDCLDG